MRKGNRRRVCARSKERPQSNGHKDEGGCQAEWFARLTPEEHPSYAEQGQCLEERQHQSIDGVARRCNPYTVKRLSRGRSDKAACSSPGTDGKSISERLQQSEQDDDEFGQHESDPYCSREIQPAPL